MKDVEVADVVDEETKTRKTAMKKIRMEINITDIIIIIIAIEHNQMVQFTVKMETLKDIITDGVSTDAKIKQMIKTAIKLKMKKENEEDIVKEDTTIEEIQMKMVSLSMTQNGTRIMMFQCLKEM